jgi:hypothetical protein
MVAVVHVAGAEAVESAVDVAGLADAVLLDTRTEKNPQGRKDATACAAFVKAARIPA